MKKYMVLFLAALMAMGNVFFVQAEEGLRRRKNIQKTKLFSECVDGAFYLCYAIKAQETKALFFVLKIWEVDNRGFKAYQNHSCLYRVQTS